MPTILLLEDNDQIRANTAELLGMAGYVVQAAANGQLGIALALAAKPDLVLCDIMMPELDGYGVLQIFNQNPQLAGVPFIFLTAKAERADVRRGMDLGADDYLAKPFNKAELLSAVGNRLARFRRLKPEYDLRAAGTLGDFLEDARAVGQLADLSRDRKVHPVRKKQDVYLAGDEPTRVYFVQAGRIKTVKTTAGGKELTTVVYGPGEFFGYLALLEGTPHYESAVALEDAELLYIPPPDFTALLLRSPEVSRQFIRLLAGRVRAREHLLLGMAYNSIRRRVADELLRLHAQAAAASPTIQLTRDDLAALVGTATESVIRTLSEFNQAGFIELTPNNIRVLQPEQLRRAQW